MKHPIKVAACPLPPGSRIVQTVPGADFADCYTLPDPHPELDALHTYLAIFARTPRWMHALMAIRNGVVRHLGLKHADGLRVAEPQRSPATYQPGDRMGIFTLAQATSKEAVVFDDDKHLKVQLSLFKHTVNGQPMVSLSTVVHIHNRLGRAYMSVVGPAHKLIVPLMLAQAAQA
jgi:Protein of unknown function (DUF2867)